MSCYPAVYGCGALALRQVSLQRFELLLAVLYLLSDSLDMAARIWMPGSGSRFWYSGCVFRIWYLVYISSLFGVSRWGHEVILYIWDLKNKETFL